MQKINSNIVPFTVFAIFGIIYCLISLVNHYLFRTSALDLGMFNQALYHCSHFQENIFTLDIHEEEAHYFASHFSPIIYLYCPFYYFFGSYTLLIIQIALILGGGIAVYRISLDYFREKLIPLLIMVHFYGIWGIYSALSFDFHDNVTASMLVPWFVYFFLKKNVKISVVFFVLILLTRENMALWMIFILTGLILGKRRMGKPEFRESLRFTIILMISASIYFLLVVEFIMPSFSGDGSSSQMARFSDFGDSTIEIAANIIRYPGKIFRLLFVSTIDGEIYKGIKMETHLMVLLSGGFAFLVFPEFLVMLIPVYLQKFITDDYALWGINAHYSIEFVPIISIAVIFLIYKITNIKFRIIMLGFIILLTNIATYTSIEKRKSLWYDPVNTAFYSKAHYDSMLNHKMIRREINKIPSEAVISASTFLTPHLAAREKIYMFPVVKDAEYIILLTKNRIPYPLNEEQFSEELNKYRNSSSFQIIFEKEELLIFRKRI